MGSQLPSHEGRVQPSRWEHMLGVGDNEPTKWFSKSFSRAQNRLAILYVGFETWSLLCDVNKHLYLPEPVLSTVVRRVTNMSQVGTSLILTLNTHVFNPKPVAVMVTLVLRLKKTRAQSSQQVSVNGRLQEVVCTVWFCVCVCVGVGLLVIFFTLEMPVAFP